MKSGWILEALDPELPDGFVTGRGSGLEEDDCNSDLAATHTAILPSRAPTDADGLPHDLDLQDVDEEIMIRPDWSSAATKEASYFDGI